MGTGARGWTLKAASARAEHEWQQAMAAEPELIKEVRERLTMRPVDRSDNPSRTHRLWPPLASKKIGDKVLPQWQHEISALGRIHYCPDQDDRIVWVTLVSLRHPRSTE